MKKYICLLVIVFFCSNFAKSQNKLLTAEIKKFGDYNEIWATNNGYSNITLSIEFSQRNNIKTDVAEPIMTVLKQGETKKIVKISGADKNRAWNYYYNYFYRLGTPYASNNCTAYRLPYKSGEKYRIMQGANGSFSHFGDEANAIDFDMPEGTELVAARAGTVAQVVQEYDGGGTTKDYKSKTNFIRIEHNDGTIAEYAHIRQYGSEVSVGDIVTEGQLIGYSGNVGYSTAPHLHFHVCKPQDGKRISTFAIKFKTKTSPRGEELLQNNYYTAP